MSTDCNFLQSLEFHHTKTHHNFVIDIRSQRLFLRFDTTFCHWVRYRKTIQRNFRFAFYLIFLCFLCGIRFLFFPTICLSFRRGTGKPRFLLISAKPFLSWEWSLHFYLFTHLHFLFWEELFEREWFLRALTFIILVFLFLSIFLQWWSPLLLFCRIVSRII